MKDRIHLIPSGVLEFHEDGRIHWANAKLHNILGLPPEELIGRKVDEILSPSSRIFHQTHVLPLLRLDHKVDEVYLTLRGQTGVKIPVLANAVRLAHGSSFHILCAFMPVEKRGKYEDEILAAKRKAEEAISNNEGLLRLKQELELRLDDLDRHARALHCKNRELLRLNQILSHDLREPLRKIRAYADLLLQENKDVLTENGTMAVSRIDAGCDRIHELLRVLQQYLTADSHGELVLGIALDKIVATALSRARSTGAEIQLTVEDLPTIDGYPNQLVTLFEVLMMNAIRMGSEETAAITLTSTLIQHNSFQKIVGKYRYVDSVQVTFSDNSQGFGCIDCAPLFDLLSRTDRSELFDSGLAICRRIVENHHGTISLQSPPGRGSTFTILLPLKQPLNARTPQPTEPQP